MPTKTPRKHKGKKINNFILGSALGTGNFGAVYHCTPTPKADLSKLTPGRSVCCKVINLQDQIPEQQDQINEYILTEHKNMSRIRHPNLIKLVDAA